MTTSTTAEELAAGYEALAAFIRERPELADHIFCPEALVIPVKPEQVPEVVALIGTATKGDRGDQVHVVRKFGPVELKAMIGKDLMCERVQVGTTTVERVVYPDDVVPTMVTEEVPVFEWQCSKPLLAVEAVQGIAHLAGIETEVTL